MNDKGKAERPYGHMGADFGTVTGGQVEWYDDGRTVIKLDTARAERREESAQEWAPTAIFRWAKSSPSAPPVLQQKWMGGYYGEPIGEEWRELETVIHDEAVVTVPAGEVDEAKAALLDVLRNKA